MYWASLRMLAIISLLALFAGCGQNSNLKSRVVAPPLAKGIAFDVSYLHIYSAEGIHCENHSHYVLDVDTLPNAPRANLVLTTDRLKYDSGELQQMLAYVGAVYGLVDLPLSQPPSTLSWVPGGVKVYLPAAELTGCYGEMEVTNVGKNTIQIRSMDVRLTAVPQQNRRRQYRLIDLCSLVPKSITCPPEGAGGTPLVYNFQLSPANKGAVFSAQTLNGDGQVQNGLETTLNPNDTVFVYAAFNSSPDNLIYSVVPDLVFDTPDGQQTVALPQLASTLYFADDSQFSCYSLQRDTFVQVPKDKYFCI